MSLSFSVVVPTRGNPTRLLPLLEALSHQALPRSRFEILVSFDGVGPDSEQRRRLASAGAQAVESPTRSGPGAARNRAAYAAGGAYLAFTEDDCVPAHDWLERAAARLEREPKIDVLEGDTVQPDGRPSRRPDRGRLHYLPTNLFVRRALFHRVGGYCEAFFDRRGSVYFREDSDLGFSLEEAGAHVAREPTARVVHPIEHARYLDPLRWARRYEMDALLRSRHPARFRERIEVHRVGRFTVRRPLVRSCYAYVLALAGAAVALVLRERVVAASLLGLAAVSLIPLWAKWHFRPSRLPVVMLVPFTLVAAQVMGAVRAARTKGHVRRAPQ
jgi:glycosyltransferase involved in cell wall biosynthesis